MIPVFTSAYSLKSILIIEPQTVKEDKTVDKETSSSIYNIAKDNDLKHVVILEENMTSFMEAKKFLEKEFHLIYGVRMSFGTKESNSKIAVFAKNSSGYFDLMNLYSHYKTECESVLTESSLDKYLTDNLMLVIPFYDSFLHKNLTSFSNVVFPTKYNLTFFVERNGLFIDSILEDTVKSYIKNFGGKTELTKSIFYENREDVKAYMVYRCIQNRGGGTNIPTLTKPNLEGFSSNNFCIESWKEQKNESA